MQCNAALMRPSMHARPLLVSGSFWLSQKGRRRIRRVPRTLPCKLQAGRQTDRGAPATARLLAASCSPGWLAASIINHGWLMAAPPAARPRLPAWRPAAS